ncbi:MAG: ABC transporter permease [Bacteroidales bacterium]|nr:ABC transporter permease [Bacteroidales bacterium]
MDASRFIARRMRFQGRLPLAAIAISYLVMILAVAISGGFRSHIRAALSDMAGDVRLTPYAEPASAHPSYLGKLDSLPGVAAVTPVIYRAGIVKGEKDIQGVLVKGVPQADSSKLLAVRIPARLARRLSLAEGDAMLTYFVGEKVQARRFVVAEVYESAVEADDRLVVYAPLATMQRLSGWDADGVSALEIRVRDGWRTERRLRELAQAAGTVSMLWAREDEQVLRAASVVELYPQMFDWLTLIDFNVLAILLLMTLVAGFNMISGLLILLFRQVSMIGTLKALGMEDRAIARVFLRISARAVFWGMALGNAVALLCCAAQHLTHLVKLNPENYFVSYVPVDISLLSLLLADAVSFLVILALVTLPCLFVARVDPATSVKVR